MDNTRKQTAIQHLHQAQVWHPGSSKMYPFGGVIFDKLAPNCIWVKDSELGSVSLHEREAIVLQFTGYEDKHGKPIHDQDLVKDDQGVLYIVAWGRFEDTMMEGETWLIYKPDEGCLHKDGRWIPFDEPVCGTVYRNQINLEVVESFYENPGSFLEVVSSD